MIRRAYIADVPAMGKIINDCAEFGQMLPRSLAALYENLREFQVAVDDADPQQVIGVCGLSIIWADLAEVVALAVAPGARGRGIGRDLVKACIAEAEKLRIRKVMTLTYERVFFEKLGFEVMDRANLPHKVWADCVRCPKNDACDEIAMLLTLDSVPLTETPAPPISSRYDVPVVLTTHRKDGPRHSD